MSSITTTTEAYVPADFPVLTPESSTSLLSPAFLVSTMRGFLPRTEPPAKLPPEFGAAESLLQRMPIRTATGLPGLLSELDTPGRLESITFGEAVDQELPDLSSEVAHYKDDMLIITALYRDYSFLASAYLLEPCHRRHVKGKGYGLARNRLPRSIALPLVTVAKIAGFAPFMEYAGSYALYNYRLAQPAQGISYDNLRLIRAFEHGIAPSNAPDLIGHPDPPSESSEAGFVLVHVDMAKSSGELVSGAWEALQACAEGKTGIHRFNSGLRDVISSMNTINAAMNDMWKRSKPNEYTNFRTFIFGITSQSMFPNGVVYEGVSEEPKAFRGESGANDSIIPLCDNLLDITMPNTPLTDILEDFRSYRPGNHREFLAWVKQRSRKLNLRSFAMQTSESASLYLQCLNQVRDFRWRHWMFTREYILKQTAHPTATGGSPIVTWLPNQLQAVLDAMLDVGRHFDEKAWKLSEIDQDILDISKEQSNKLRKEVEKYCEERGVKRT